MHRSNAHGNGMIHSITKKLSPIDSTRDGDPRRSFTRAQGSTRPPSVVSYAMLCIVCAGAFFAGCGDSEKPSEESASTSVAKAKSQPPDTSAPKTDSVPIDERGDAIVAQWDNRAIYYSQIRDRISTDEAIMMQRMSGTDLTPHIVRQMEQLVDRMVEAALKVEEAIEREIEVSDEQVEEAIRRLRASAQNERQFQAMVHGATGEGLQKLIRNQMRAQIVETVVKQDIRDSITEDVKRQYYQENVKTKFTPTAYTEGRRFVIEARSEPPGEFPSDLLKLVKRTLAPLGREAEPSKAVAAVRSLPDAAFAALLKPAPTLWNEDTIPRLREAAVNLVPYAAQADEATALESARALLTDVYACFLGRSKEEALERARALRGQAQALISAATDVVGRDALFKPFVRQFSEDDLIHVSLGYVNIYHIIGTGGPASSFGEEFMRVAQTTPVGELSQVASVPTGYGFMLPKRKRPEITHPYESESVQLHLGPLIEGEEYEAWREDLYARHNLQVRKDVMKELAKRDFGGGGVFAPVPAN